MHDIINSECAQPDFASNNISAFAGSLDLESVDDELVVLKACRSRHMVHAFAVEGMSRRNTESDMVVRSGTRVAAARVARWRSLFMTSTAAGELPTARVFSGTAGCRKCGLRHFCYMAPSIT